MFLGKIKNGLDSVFVFFTITVIAYVAIEYRRGLAAVKKLKSIKLKDELKEIENDFNEKDINDLVDYANKHNSERKDGHSN